MGISITIDSKYVELKNRLMVDYISFKKFIYDNAIASNNEKINLLTLDNNYIDLLKNYDVEIKWKKYIFKLTFSFKF